MQPRNRIVIKLGTSTLTAGGKRISLPVMVNLARQIAVLLEQGFEIILVSSGAISAGREALGFPTLQKNVPSKQMFAAVGQTRLMATYEQVFGIYNLRVAQILLTREDLSDRERFLNARDTFEALLKNRIIPIVNENDTVATEEIRIGDNDNLSALVSNLVEADLLLLLTDQEGLYTSDPRKDPNAQLIQQVEPKPFPAELWQAAGGSSSGLGIGGMITKLQAADLARHGGTTIIIASGSETDVLLRLGRGESLGTRILPLINKLEGRKRRILSSRHPSGEIVVDAGAVRALAHGGSLLPVGVKEVRGKFERGEPANVLSHDRKAIAVGLTNYASADLARIAGQKSSEIEDTLGFTFGDEVIHHNNLILL